MPRILSLMFHQIHDPLKQERVTQFEHFLKTLVQKYQIVLPNDAKRHAKPALCLTFDDAYYDFYHYVYPLLKKWNIKALLAVPVKAIRADSHAPAHERLAFAYTHPTTAIPSPVATPLCTWKELKEMADSGHVIIASHGYCHADLTSKETDHQEEVERSKAILQEQLNRPIHYFVYPYGRMTRQLHQYVRKHYAFGIRIGNAYNFGGASRSGLIYRINADPFWTSNRNMDHPYMKLKLSLKYYGNKLRKK